MILQRDLKLYRFKNQKPHPEHCPEKFAYQLFHGKELLFAEYSDREFRMGLVTIDTAKKARVELINSTQEIESQDMEDVNTFLLDVTVESN